MLDGIYVRFNLILCRYWNWSVTWSICCMYTTSHCHKLRNTIQNVWVLSACSFSPYSGDWWECSFEMISDDTMSVTPQWQGDIPRIMTHKQLAKDMAVEHTSEGLTWTSYSDYDVVLTYFGTFTFVRFFLCLCCGWQTLKKWLLYFLFVIKM